MCLHFALSQVRKKAQDVFFNCQELSINSKREMMSLILPSLKEDPDIPHYQFKVSRLIMNHSTKVRQEKPYFVPLYQYKVRKIPNIPHHQVKVSQNPRNLFTKCMYRSFTLIPKTRVRKPLPHQQYKVKGTAIFRTVS